MITKSGRCEFFDEERFPLCPLYWMDNPKKIKAYVIYDLDLGDLIVVDTINALPHHLPTRDLVDCLPFEDCDRIAFDTLFVRFMIYY